jgi:hypothetical protein
MENYNITGCEIIARYFYLSNTFNETTGDKTVDYFNDTYMGPFTNGSTENDDLLKSLLQDIEEF